MNKKNMNKKNILIALLLFLLLVSSAAILASSSKKKGEYPLKSEQKKAKGIMILIEFKDTVGLKHFTNLMNRRNIKGLLMVTPEFVKDNCEDVKEVMKSGMEIVASNVDGPFWDIPYEEQKSRIIEMNKDIEACTGVPIRIISSRYMASDATTFKVAEELGIPYITARGTTDTKATVYEVEGYNTKILSVSNIPIPTFKYGSLCDYSFFERGGTPADMRAELDRSLEPLTSKEIARYGANHKVTPVSHTWIGGYLKPWNDMWLNFWDESEDLIEWVSLDEFMSEPDWVLPLWQVPVNKNSPYTPERMNPLVPYEDEEKVLNICG